MRGDFPHFRSKRCFSYYPSFPSLEKVFIYYSSFPTSIARKGVIYIHPFPLPCALDSPQVFSSKKAMYAQSAVSVLRAQRCCWTTSTSARPPCHALGAPCRAGTSLYGCFLHPKPMKERVSAKSRFFDRICIVPPFVQFPEKHWLFYYGMH